MSLKDIEKLRERVEKDPNSKMFVPLAEEYRKEGMLEEAINVLLAGLERQPGYTSARVSLGKIYLEKGMQKEAQTEFENVIQVIPDNLYAQKKLAEIYRSIGEKTLAVSTYKKVLKLNPLDEEALNSLRETEEEESEMQPVLETTAIEMPAAEPVEDIFAEEHAEESPVGGPVIEEIPVEAPVSDDDLSAFKDSIFGDKGVMDEADKAEVLEEKGLGTVDTGDVAVEDELSFNDIEEDAETVAPDVAEMPEELAAAADEDELSFADIEEETEAVAPDMAEIPEELAAAADEDELSFADIEEEAEVEVPAAEIPQEAAAVAVEDAYSFGDVNEEIDTESLSGELPEESLEAVDEEVFAEEMPAEDFSFGEIKVEPKSAAPSAEEPATAFTGAEPQILKAQPSHLTFEDADKFISENKYWDAVRVYKRILAANPDDKKVVQRLDELRALLKMLGKDKEELVFRLNTLLEGLKKRRDEFYRHS